MKRIDELRAMSIREIRKLLPPNYGNYDESPYSELADDEMIKIALSPQPLDGLSDSVKIEIDCIRDILDIDDEF
jgi:hypothetical protein